MADRSRLDRHLDPDAAGSPVRLLPGLLADPGHVAVIIGDQDVTTPRGQLLTWATVNLLLRCYSVLATVTVHCPDVALAAPLPRVSAGSAPLSLHQALAALATATAEPRGRGPVLSSSLAALPAGCGRHGDSGTRHPVRQRGGRVTAGRRDVAGHRGSMETQYRLPGCAHPRQSHPAAAAG